MGRVGSTVAVGPLLDHPDFTTHTSKDAAAGKSVYLEACCKGAGNEARNKAQLSNLLRKRKSRSKTLQEQQARRSSPNSSLVRALIFFNFSLKSLFGSFFHQTKRFEGKRFFGQAFFLNFFDNPMVPGTCGVSVCSVPQTPPYNAYINLFHPVFRLQPSLCCNL